MGRYDILTGRVKPTKHRRVEPAESWDVEGFFNLTLKLVNEMMSRLSEETYQNLKRIDPPELYKKDHATFRLSLPRRMGNTTLATKLFEHYLNQGENVFLSVPARHYIRNIPWSASTERAPITRIITPQMNDLYGIDPSIIIVDMVTYMKPEQLEIIYNVRSDFYILLG